MHTAPPLPPFIHCAQEVPQPPLVTLAQLRDSGATASQVLDGGLPNSCTTGAGAEEVDVEPEDESGTPPLIERVLVSPSQFPIGLVTTLKVMKLGDELVMV